MDPAGKRSRSNKRPNKRPMAYVRRIGIFRREIRESVSPAALDLLLASAERISEGQIAAERYLGSTMLTVDLTRVHGVVQDACDVATAARLARHLEGEPHVKLALQELALKEARRIASCPLELVDAEVRVRVEGTRLFLDVDVEGALQVSASAANHD